MLALKLSGDYGMRVYRNEMKSNERESSPDSGEANMGGEERSQGKYVRALHMHV